MGLEQDIKQLEDHIRMLIKASKDHTTTEMVMGCIPPATLYNFNYVIMNNPFAITSITLKKVAKRLDELEPNQSYYDNLIQTVTHFVNTYIMVDSIHVLTKLGFNYITLKKIENTQLDNPYRLETLIKYATMINEKIEGGVLGANH